MPTEVTTPQAHEPSEREIARGLKRRRRNRNILRAIFLPAILSLVYYLVVAPAAYHSKIEFTIQGTDKGAPDLLSGLGIPAVSGASNDARLVSDYLRSAEIISHLRKNFGFAQAYSRFTLDPTAYLPADASIERAEDFWHDRAKVDYDASANVISVTVTAYRPEDAKRLSEGVLDGANTVVNQLDRRVTETSRSFAERQLAEQKQIYDDVRRRVAQVRGTQAMTLDARSAQAVQMIAQIDTQIATLRVQQAAGATTYQPNAPQARAISAQIASLQTARGEAIHNAQQGPGQNVAESDIAAHTALLDYEFAQKSYYGALQAYQSAVHQSAGNHRYIVAFIPPRLPESSNYWSRLWNVLAITLASAILVGVGMLTYSVIKDHAQ